jgi:predicted DNA-binding ribbon-helix-helix protein
MKKTGGNKKRSVIIMNKRTSVCLEDSFWHSLHAIVRLEETTVEQFIEKVKREHDPHNLSSSIRVAVLEYFQNLLARDMAGRTDNPLAMPTAESGNDRGSKLQRDKVIAFWSGVRGMTSQYG